MMATMVSYLPLWQRPSREFVLNINAAIMISVENMGKGLTLKRHLRTGGNHEIACVSATRATVTILGDVRGSISIFYSSISSSTAAAAIDEYNNVLPTQFFRKIHAAEPATCLAMKDDLSFYSGGADGFLRYYRRESEHDEEFQLVQEWSCQPFGISVPEEIIFNAENSDISMVCGFHADGFLVVDVHTSYQLVKVHAGSWRRPHHWRISQRNQVSFYEVCPVGTKSSELLRLVSQPALYVSPDSKDWLLMITSGNGRVCYDGCTFEHMGRLHFVIGGLDGKANVYHHSSSDHGDDCVHLQEVQLPHNSVIKAMCSSASACGQNIMVVGAGGRLCYALWTVSGAKQPLTIASRGTLWEEATQDHRIMSCAAVHHPDNESHYIVFCDSRGLVSLMVKSDSSSSSNYKNKDFGKSAPGEPQLLEQIQCAEGPYPVLSCELILCHQTLIGCFGSSSGSVSVWILRGTCIESVRMDQSCKVAEFEAHSMGANCLSAIATPLLTDGSCFSLLLATGGDDQAITLAHGVAKVVVRDGTLGWAWQQDLKPLRSTSCGGSAFKGLHLTQTASCDCFTLRSLCADQRVQTWVVAPSFYGIATAGSSADDANVRTTEVVEVKAHCALAEGEEVILQWTNGKLTTIGDPQSSALLGGSLLVIGEGVQVL